MKIKLLILSGLVFLAINCFSQSKSNNIVQNKKDKSLIIGIWTNGQTENATFEINKDSILYVENYQKYSYNIVGDSLIIHFDGFDSASKIDKLSNDSLILFKGRKRLKYWRFKN